MRKLPRCGTGDRAKNTHCELSSFGPALFEIWWPDIYLGGPYGPVTDKMYWPELVRRSEKFAGPAGKCLCRGLRGIDRSAFVADLETELVGIGHSLSADQYNVTLLSVLDKHAPAAKSRVTERMSSPWFGLVREDLPEAKRIRRQAERKWRNTNLTVFKDLYKKAKHHVTKVVLKAKKLYYNSKISSANCSKELYKITNNILARTKQVHLPTMYPLSSLPEMFSNYFSDKIIIIRNELDSQTVSALPAQTDSFSGQGAKYTALCCAAAVTCREALKMCGRYGARLAAMP